MSRNSQVNSIFKRVHQTIDNIIITLKDQDIVLNN